jgi:tape measure domain-containing protein
MARKVIAEFDAIDGPFINKLNAIDRSVARFEAGTLNAFGRVEKGMSGLLASAARLQNVSGIIAGGFGAGLAAQYVDQATRIRRALEQVGGSGDEAFNQVFLAAQRSLSGFDAFAQGVSRMQKATGGTFEDSVRNMETLNKLLALGGKTTQERMSTMIQFSQALQANVLQGEELRSLRENAPIELVRAIAQEAGGTIEDLKDLGAQGAITADVMIRALQRLESEADARMRNVTLTISEAATVLGNAGIVAVESFDKGLGLSRAAVTGLTGLADVLAKSAEANEMFSKALGVTVTHAESLGILVKGLGALLLTSYAGRGVQSAIAATKAYSLSLQQAVLAARAEAFATKAAADAALIARDKRLALVAAIQAEIAAKGTSDKLTAQLARNQIALAGAEGRLIDRRFESAQAADRVTDATKRLGLAARTTAGAGRALQGAFNFLGGWPGLILAVGTAFLTMSSNAETAADKFDRLTSDTGSAQAAADALVNVQGLLKEALEASGNASDEASRRIIANTMNELAAKRTLLELEQGALLKAQEERRAEIDRLTAERNAVPGMDDRQAGIEGDLLGVFPQGSEAAAEAFAERMAMALDEYNAELEVANSKIREMEAAYLLAGGQIDRNNSLLGSTAVTIAQAAVESFGLSDALAAAFGSASGIAGTNMSGAIDPAASSAQRLVAYLASAWNWVRSLVGMAPTVPATGGPAPAFESRGRNGSNPGPVLPPAPPTFAEVVARNAPAGGGGGGGSGGGGKSAEQEAHEDALQFIEQMMTAEERRAKQIKEAIELRNVLIKTYGVESEVVAQMDEAIQRLQSQQNEAKQKVEELADSLSEAFASAALEGASLRRSLARIFAGIANDILASGIKDALLSVLNVQGAGGGGGGGVLGKILGFFGFANGGIMSGSGPLPLKKYSRGGVATSAQVAVYGEGDMNEAFVPLPDGRTIPVTLRIPTGSGMSGVQYVEVPYIARVDADDGGRLVGRIERVRQEALLGDALTARQVSGSIPGVLRQHQSRGAP